MEEAAKTDKNEGGGGHLANGGWPRPEVLFSSSIVSQPPAWASPSLARPTFAPLVDTIASLTYSCEAAPPGMCWLVTDSQVLLSRPGSPHQARQLTNKLTSRTILISVALPTSTFLS